MNSNMHEGEHIDANSKALFLDGGSVSKIVRVDNGQVPSLGPAACAIGVFDGVHTGHAEIISDCVGFAKEHGVASVILTFDIDPCELLCSSFPRKLMSNDDRISALARQGADIVAVQRFDDDFAQMEAGAFIARLVEMTDPAAVFVGNNFRFGRGAVGDADLLMHELSGRGCNVEAEALYCADGTPVASTRIRESVESGDMQAAASLLGRPFYIRACVCRGRQVGRTLGFPTANLVPDADYARPAGGVYVGHVMVAGTWHRASISVGAPKTFGDDIAPTIEAHLIDFDADIYDEHVLACFERYISPMEKFGSVDELIQAIGRYTQMAADQPSAPNLLFSTE